MGTYLPVCQHVFQWMAASHGVTHAKFSLTPSSWACRPRGGEERWSVCVKWKWKLSWHVRPGGVVSMHVMFDHGCALMIRRRGMERMHKNARLLKCKLVRRFYTPSSISCRRDTKTDHPWWRQEEHLIKNTQVQTLGERDGNGGKKKKRGDLFQEGGGWVGWLTGYLKAKLEINNIKVATN